MAKTFRIELSDMDLGQVLDGLEMRAEAWERTAEFLRTDSMSEGEFFVVEECSRPAEADAIAKHYRSILRKIHSQMEVQQ
jgi:hypothetical protein